MNVDWERVNSFITEGDEEEMEWLRDMVKSLISNFEERLAELSEINKSQDNEQLKSLLHQMKGVTSNFGLENLRKITHNAELFAKENKIKEALTESAKILDVWTETKSELRSKLNV